MKALKVGFAWIALIGAFIFMSACSRHDYPCPGLGQGNEKDFALFDENGQPKDPKAAKKAQSNRRINHDNGMVNKKNPKRLKAPRKTHI